MVAIARRIRLAAAAGLALWLLGSLPVSPAGAGWSDQFSPPGVSSDVFALFPRDGELIAAGWFGDAGGVRVKRIGRWDGRRWDPMGGRGQDNFVDFAEFRGDIYAIGGFSASWDVLEGTMARWDGASWSVIHGVDLHSPSAIVVYNDELVVSAYWVVPADGDTIRAIARWDGENWSPLGEGLGGAHPYVACLTVHEGRLYAGGEFTEAGGAPAGNVACWDGERWTPVGTGLDAGVRTLAWFGDGLVAGGNFTRVDADSVNGIAWWRDGAWHSMAGGMSHRSRYARPGHVEALVVWRDRLIAGGEFEYAGEQLVNSVAAWNGEEWEALGPSGVAGPGVLGEGVRAVTAPVHALAVYDDRLYAGGSFQYAGGLYTRPLAMFDGSRWSRVGGGLALGGTADAVTEYQGLTVFGGRFVSAGDTVAALVAGWDGTRWLPLGDGLWDPRSDYQYVGALIEHEGALLAAWVNSRPACCGCGGGSTSLARWDGTSWTSLAAECSVHGVVGAMAVYRGDLIVAGEFDSVGTVAAANIARWDGTQWHALGLGVDDKVFTLHVLGDTLYVGGNLRNAGGVPANFCAAWDGERWLPMANGTGGTVIDFATLDGELVVGGYFWVANGVRVNSIARWSGGRWRPVGPGFIELMFGDVPSDNPAAVEVLSVYRGRLVAAGQFDFAGADSAQGFAVWDGTYWEGLSPGPTGEVRCAHSTEDCLFIGGYDYVRDANVRSWEGELPPGPSPVEDLSAASTATGVRLTWRTPRVDGFEGFRVDRRVGSGPWARAGADTLLPARGASEWSEDLTEDLAGAIFTYRVVPVLVGGDDAASHGETTLEYAPTGPVARVLGAPHPNPVRRGETTRVALTLPREESVRLDVFDPAGRRVRTLEAGASGPGTLLVDWDGTDDRGTRAAAGVYLLRLVGSGRSLSRRVVLLP